MSAEITLQKFTSRNLTAFMLCTDFILDTTNSISIIKMFTDIQAKTLPAPFDFWVYFAFKNIGEGNHEVKITIKKPEDIEEIEVATNNSYVDSEYINFNTFQKIQTQFEEYGVCYVFGYVDGQLVGEANVRVIPMND